MHHKQAGVQMVLSLLPYFSKCDDSVLKMVAEVPLEELDGGVYPLFNCPEKHYKYTNS